MKSYIKKAISLPVLAAGFIFFTFTSCEKAFMEPLGDKDPLSVFDEFYEVMDEKFVMDAAYGFDYKLVMDSMRNELVKEPTNDKLKLLFKDLFDNKIRDGHSLMIAGEDLFVYDYEKGYPDIMNEEVLVNKYLYSENISVIPSGDEIFLAHGLLPENPKIGYLFIAEFSEIPTDAEIDRIFESFKDAESLIIDLRGNIGGYVETAAKIASRFYETDKEIGIVRIKENKRTIKDFPYIAHAQKGRPNFVNKPIAVLTDRSVFSSATMLCEILRATIDPIFVGQRTGGGTSGFISGILSNGWSYRIATNEVIFFDEKGTTIRSNHGFEPNYHVELDESNPKNDQVLEKAIDLLSK